MKNVLDNLDRLRNGHKLTFTLYKPEFYRLSESKTIDSFQKLLETPGLTVVDLIADQLKELIKFRHADRKLQERELSQLLEDHLSGTLLHEYGVWVYYPWSRRLVHLLDEEEFVTVRTSRNQYKITPAEKDILAKKKIGVIGLSVGQSVSVTLAMERICGELRLADFDTLELTNLNRIRTGVHNLGLPKVYSVAREISEIDPFLKVLCFPDGLTEENMDDFFTGNGKLDLLVEESDGFDIKILSRYKARDLGIPVIMEGSDRCLVDVERFDLEPKRSILHGLVDHLDIGLLKTLKTNEEKIPYMLDILGLENSSLRLKASMLEIEQTINTWPQLASAVTMGGGITADVARRMLLNQYTESGRYHIDIEELIGNKTTKVAPVHFTSPPATSLQELSVLCKDLSIGGGLELSEALITEIVNAGALAPSGGNAQPWRFVYTKGVLHLFNGFDTSSSLLGYNNLASLVALGACAENISLKAASLGLAAELHFRPDPSVPDLIASFTFSQDAAASSKASLSAMIGLRLTNRMLGKRESIEEKILSALQTAVATVKGMKLHFITTDDGLSSVADVLGELEKIRLLEERGHHDFVNEIRWTIDENERTRDGIDIRTLDISNSERVGLEVAKDPDIIRYLKDWNGGGAFKKLTKKSIDSAGAIGVITAERSADESFFNGGRALEKAWLTANANGVSFQPAAASVFLYARHSQGKGQGISAEGNYRLRELRKAYEKILKIDQDRCEIFFFRLCKSADPKVKSLRKPLDELFCYVQK